MHRYSLHFMALWLLSCTPHAETVEQNSEIDSRTNQIVLIFNEPPVNNRYKLDERNVLQNEGEHEIEYVNDTLITQYIKLKYAPESDTIVIHTKRDVIEVQHAYMGTDQLSYYFHNGDSVVFTYEGLKPTARILNRKILPYDLNYDIKKREVIHQNELPAYEKYYSFLLLYDIDFKNLVANARRILKQVREEAEKERNKELIFLDSL